MMEGDWIAMPGVPLIVAGNPEAGVGVEDDGTSVPDDGARTAEEATGPTFDKARVDRATTPSDEVECAEAAVGTVAPVLASPGAAAVSEEDAAPTLDEVAPAAVNAEENTGGDTSEMEHAAELEAALLAANSPGREGPPSLQPPSQLRLRSSPLKPRSEGHQAWFCKQMIHFLLEPWLY
jgi:hypothetical protein